MKQANNSSGFLMKPKIDFAFKEIMANEKARIGFLSAILKIAPSDIKESNCENILLWAKFINAEQKEDFEMLASKSPYIESAYRQLQIISQDKDKRLEYEARQKAILDHNQFLYEAEQRGREQGEKIGREATAKNLLSLGVSIDTIVAATNLSIAEIEALQK